MGEQEALSDLDRQVIKFVREYRERNGNGPTDAEGATHFGWSSGWAFGSRVKKLVERGLLVRDGGHRGLRVAGEAPGRNRRKIPVYCEISCGPPMPPGDDPPDEIDLDDAFNPDEVIFVKARGDSMIDAQIRSGDFVAIKKDVEWKSGDTVVARIEGELTLKKIERRFNRSSGEAEYWLHPCNSKLKPFRLNPTDQNEIVGVFAGVIRLEKSKK